MRYEVPLASHEVAGNSPVYSHGCKLSPVVAKKVTGKPRLFTPGRKLYFRYCSHRLCGLTLCGYALVSVREPEDKNLDLQLERLARASRPWGNIRAEEASSEKNDLAELLECRTRWLRGTLC